MRNMCIRFQSCFTRDFQCDGGESVAEEPDGACMEQHLKVATHAEHGGLAMKMASLAEQGQTTSWPVLQAL